MSLCVKPTAGGPEFVEPEDVFEVVLWLRQSWWTSSLLLVSLQNSKINTFLIIDDWNHLFFVSWADYYSSYYCTRYLLKNDRVNSFIAF